MKLTIREIEKSDFAQWQPLFRGYRQFYKQPDDADKEAITWQWLVDGSEPIVGVVCEDTETNKLLGFMHFEQQTSSLSAAKVGFLNDLYIEPDCRGCDDQGNSIFTLLNNYMRDYGKQHNWLYIQWRTAEDNYRARAAYDRISEKTVFHTYRMTLS